MNVSEESDLFYLLTWSFESYIQIFLIFTALPRKHYPPIEAFHPDHLFS